MSCRYKIWIDGVPQGHWECHLDKPNIDGEFQTVPDDCWCSKLESKEITRDSE